MPRQDTQFKPGKSGNPRGRPRGARNRATLAAEALLDGEAEAITRKCIDLALAGDHTALRLCLSRILPVRRDREIDLDLGHARAREQEERRGEHGRRRKGRGTVCEKQSRQTKITV